MRWRIQYKKKPFSGECKVVKRFAWLPTIVDGVGTTCVWLEFYQSHMEYSFYTGWSEMKRTMYDRT